VSKNRYAARTDSNQADIIDKLRKIPGITAMPGHDDIIVGFCGMTFWYEIKSDRAVSKKTGKIRESEKKTSQKVLEKTFAGHFKIVSSYEDILRDLILFFDCLKPFNYVSKNLRIFLDTNI
jgi:hypothetical protein